MPADAPAASSTDKSTPCASGFGRDQNVVLALAAEAARIVLSSCAMPACANKRERVWLAIFRKTLGEMHVQREPHGRGIALER